MHRNRFVTAIPCGVALIALAVAAWHWDHRLDRLEQDRWGESQAPPVIDPNAEVVAYGYDLAELRLSVRPQLAPLVARVFTDGVISNAELDEVEAGYHALADKEREALNIEDVKAALRRTLEQVPRSSRPSP